MSGRVAPTGACGTVAVRGARAATVRCARGALSVRAHAVGGRPAVVAFGLAVVAFALADLSLDT